jgi:hypothetical protein
MTRGAAPDRLGCREPGPAVVVSAASRALRRSLRPLVWVTLEEVALDAAVEDGKLVARTSARQVAERLGLDAISAAGALRLLRQRGLLALERENGPAGRFGLSVYMLSDTPGLSVLPPCATGPCTESPRLVAAVSAETDRTQGRASPVPPSPPCPGQMPLDLRTERS